MEAIGVTGRDKVENREIERYDLLWQPLCETS